MASRNTMVLALVKYELQWLMQSPEQLDNVAEFFATGGYDSMPDEEVAKCYQRNVWIHEEE